MTIFGIIFDSAFTGSREVDQGTALATAMDYLDSEFSTHFDEYYLFSGEFVTYHKRESVEEDYDNLIFGRESE